MSGTEGLELAGTDPIDLQLSRGATDSGREQSTPQSTAADFAKMKRGGNGYQAWQALLSARTARNATKILKQFLELTFTSPDSCVNLRQWNKNPAEHATRTEERVCDGIRRAVYMNKICTTRHATAIDVE